MNEATISVVSSKTLLAVFGTCDQHLRTIRETLGVSISAHDGRIHVRGSDEAVAQATQVLEQLQGQAQRSGQLGHEDVARALREVQNGQEFSSVPAIEVYHGRQVRPRTEGQAKSHPHDLLQTSSILGCCTALWVFRHRFHLSTS
jgi:phosphate starvation-inducible PhoH-like protein